MKRENKEIVNDGAFESMVRNIIDLYIEAGKHYNNVIKQQRYRTGSSQLAIDLLSGVADAKEMGIKYVLDKLKNE